MNVEIATLAEGLLIEWSSGATLKIITVAEANETLFAAQAPSVETVEADGPQPTTWISVQFGPNARRPLLYL